MLRKDKIMKKIALCSLLMCLGFVDYAAAGEKYCETECTAAREGRVVLCPQQSKSDVFVPETKICQNGKWVDGDWRNDNFFTYIKVCDNHTKPNGWQDLGRFGTISYNEYVFINKQETGVAFTLPVSSSSDHSVDLDKNLICRGCRQGFSWDEKNNKCVATQKSSVHQECDPNHPELCNQNDRVAQLGEPCAGRKEKDRCYALPSHATLGRCRNLSATTGGQTQMTCSAVKCEPNHYLWLDKNGNSMGTCHSIDYMEKMCAKNTCGCGDGQECVPNIVDIPSSITINGYNLSASERKNGAYRECHCVGKQQTVSKDCTYTFRVKCQDGTEVTGLSEYGYPITVNYTQDSLKNVQDRYGLTDSEISQCVNSRVLDGSKSLYAKMWNTDNTEFADKLKTDMTLNKKILDFCASHRGYNGANIGGGSVPDVPNSTEFENAKKTLEAFTANAASKASGWKTAEGKFNTMRLASDLSAGVVLGTVGGVVSGVVIKKKQVEKGFDALHCTVGGQTIADWGDEFSVGLAK